MSDPRTLYDPGMTLKEYADSVGKLHRLLEYIATGRATPERLRRLVAELKAIPAAYRHHMDDFDPDGEIHKPGYVEQLVLELPDLSPEAQANRARHVLKYVTPFAAQTVRPGKGGMRRQARKHMYEIQLMARHFAQTYPGARVSSDPKSRFYDYATRQLSEKYGEADYSRHIKNALEDIKQWRVIKN